MRRTYLVVPADDPGALIKTLGYGADAIVVDVVDTAGGRGTGRGIAASLLSGLVAGSPDSSTYAGGPAEIWMRIHPGPAGHEDIRELATADTGLTGVFVASVDSAVQLDALDSVLSTVETELALPGRSISVVPSLESAGALLAAAAIARAPRVSHLYLAEEEIVVELGLTPSPDEHELLWLRSQVVLASAAAGVSAPIACARPVIDGGSALRQSTMELRRLGFGGRACLDSDQLAVVDEVFRPTIEEVAAARDLLERWAAARHDTSAVCRDARGRIIDEARARRAQRVVHDAAV